MIKKYLACIFLLPAVLLTSGIKAGFSDTLHQDSKAPSLPVLCYHAINSGSSSVFDISKNAFQKQLQYLYQKHYHSISPDDLTAWLKHGKQLPPKPILITFDDGNVSDYKTVYPTLQQYAFTGTHFLIADLLDTKNKMSTEQVKEMIQNGSSVGSHSLTHKTVVNLEKGSLFREVGESKLELEKKLNCKIDYFVYPNGFFDKQAEKAVQASGYTGAFTVIPGLNDRNTNSFELRRIMVTKNVNMEKFKRLIGGEKNVLAKLWQSEIYQYLCKRMFRPAEIEAQSLLAVDPKNRIARKALQTLTRISQAGTVD